MKEKILHFTSYILFWIIIAAIIRFFGLFNPPLDGIQNWRQSDVAAVARNFLEVDSNILYPRLSYPGDKTGITGMEFPLLNYIIYLISSVFGYSHWYGRAINLVVTSIGSFFFFKIIKEQFNPKLAFTATFILIYSAWFNFARKMTPDTFSTSLVIIGIYYGIQLLQAQKKCFAFSALYVLFCGFGTLSKIPSGYLLVVLTPLFLSKETSINRKALFGIASVLIVIPVYLWYFIWNPNLIQTYGVDYFFLGKSLKTGFLEITSNLPAFSVKFYEKALRFSGFTAFIIGLTLMIRDKSIRLNLIFAIGTLLFLIVVFKAGSNFLEPGHGHYIIPYIPLMVLPAAYGINKIRNKKIFLITLTIISLEGIVNSLHDFSIKKKNKFLITLEEELDQFIKKEDLIVVNSTANPTPLYMSHRKGWLVSNVQLLDESMIKSLKENGLKYILIMKKQFGSDVSLEYKLLIDKEDYKLYTLAY